MTGIGTPFHDNSEYQWCQLPNQKTQASRLNKKTESLFVGSFALLILVRVSIASMIYQDQKQPGEERVCVNSQFHITLHHLRKSSRNWSRGHRRILFTGFLLMACSACYSYSTQDCQQSTGHCGPSQTNHQSRKFPLSLPTNQSSVGVFSVENHSLQMTLAVSN